MGALGVFVDVCPIKHFLNNLPEIFERLGKIINSPVITNHLAKIEAAHVYRAFAQRLRPVADLVMPYYQPVIMRAIEGALKDRVLKVQTAAAEAKREWETLRNAYLELERKKSTAAVAAAVEAEEGKHEVGSLGPLSAKYREARRLAKQHKAATAAPSHDSVAGEETAVGEISAAWGSAARAAKFLKKRDGTGGGTAVRSPEVCPKTVPNNVMRSSIKSALNQVASGHLPPMLLPQQRHPEELNNEQIMCRIAEEADAPDPDLQDTLQAPLPVPPQTALPRAHAGMIAQQQEFTRGILPARPTSAAQSDARDIDRDSQPALEDSLQARNPKAFVYPPQKLVQDVPSSLPTTTAAAAVPKHESEVKVVEDCVCGYVEEPPAEDVQTRPKIIAQDPPVPRATEEWLAASRCVETGRIDDGYKALLRSGTSDLTTGDVEDDLYLLRMMVQTGPACGKVATETSESVIRRANQIVRSNAVPQMLVTWVGQTVAAGLFQGFRRELQNELLDTLFELGKTKNELGQSAGELYRRITEGVNLTK